MPRKSSRSAAGTGTIRKRTVNRNGKQYTFWEARYTEGYDPGTGKQIQRSISGKTQKEVAQKLKAATAALDTGTYTAPNKLTVGQWLDIWHSEYLGSVKPSTKHAYKSFIDYQIKPGLGSVKLEALSPHIIQTFYNGLAKGTDNRSKLAASSVQTIHAVLRASINQAVKLGYIPNNPTTRCVLPRKEKKDMQAFDEAKTKEFLQEIKGHKFETVFIMALFTGMRRGELLGLTWENIDFDRGTITVNKQLQRNPFTAEYEIVPTKTNKGRTINPAPWIMLLLRKHRAQQAESKLKAGPLWTDTTLVFTNHVGRYLNPITVYINFKSITERIGCVDMRFHDLRHSYAVAALRSGDDIKTLQENLGHATATMTLDVYSHVTEQMKKASSERMDSYIKAIMSG